MRFGRLLFVVALTHVSVPALADEFMAVTPTGAAEMLFPNHATEVVGKLSNKCIDARWTVISSTPTDLVCEAPMNMGQSVLGQMLMGNSYSTPPRRFFRFNVAETNGVSRVQASGWMELQMAFGQMKRTDFSGPEFQNSIFSFMSAAGGTFPVGTRFPNHVMMGFKSEDYPMGKNAALRVTEVDPGSPAEVAGIRPDDIVFSVAGKKFKQYDDYLDATAKAAQTPTYVVDLMRDGKPLKVTVARAFRPDWTEVAKPAPDTTPAEAIKEVAAPSVADELAKLAKLRDDGVLTDAEFDAQKKKLLGL